MLLKQKIDSQMCLDCIANKVVEDSQLLEETYPGQIH